MTVCNILCMSGGAVLWWMGLGFVGLIGLCALLGSDDATCRRSVQVSTRACRLRFRQRRAARLEFVRATQHRRKQQHPGSTDRVVAAVERWVVVQGGIAAGTAAVVLAAAARRDAGFQERLCDGEGQCRAGMAQTNGWVAPCDKDVPAGNGGR